MTDGFTHPTRLALHSWITNVQASWVKLGPRGVTAELRAGVNDLGGTLMNESISRAAGSEHGQEMTPERWSRSSVRTAGGRDSARRSTPTHRLSAGRRASARHPAPTRSTRPCARRG